MVVEWGEGGEGMRGERGESWTEGSREGEQRSSKEARCGGRDKIAFEHRQDAVVFVLFSQSFGLCA